MSYKYTTNNTDRNKAFQLKHPDDVTGPAKKAYLIYMRDTLEKFANRSSFSKVIIPYGWMPLTAASDATLSSNVDSIERAAEIADRERFLVERTMDLIQILVGFNSTIVDMRCQMDLGKF